MHEKKEKRLEGGEGERENTRQQRLIELEVSSRSVGSSKGIRVASFDYEVLAATLQEQVGQRRSKVAGDLGS